MLPFTTDEFFAVFADYNQSVWPMQWILGAVAIAILVLSFGRQGWQDRAVCLLLASLWTWMAVAYHLWHFARINGAAYLFAAAFLLEAAFLSWRAIAGQPLALRLRKDWPSVLGIAMLTYSLIVYPILGDTFAHTYPAQATFGLPCPTTIFTLGILAIARGSGVGRLAVVPLLWSVVGGSASYLLGVWEDLGLFASAAALCILLTARRRRFTA